MNIYDVKVCKFISSEKKENFENVCVLKRSDFVTHYCIVDFSNFIATDIFTYQQFRILKKNTEGQITRAETVELNQEYAVYVNSLDLKQLPWWESYRIKLACFKLDLIKKKFDKRQNKQKQKKIKDSK